MRWVLLLNLICSFAVAAEDLCLHPAPPPTDFIKAQADVAQRLQSFANSPIVARQADAILGKLAGAKSPILTSWIKERHLDSKSEEDTVRAWRDYYAKYFVLMKYPQTDAQINTAVEKLVDGIASTDLTSAFQKKMEGLFHTVREMSLKKIDSFHLAPAVQKAIRARVEAVSLYWITPFHESKGRVAPLEFLDWGVAYDPTHNQINMGLNALAYGRDVTIMAVFAHELGHAFDLCRWGAFYEGPWPFQKIGECLRKSESVGAKTRDDSQLESLVKRGTVSREVAVALKMNPTCNKLIYPPPGVQADQLAESFADWFSAEVMSFAVVELAGLRDDLCEAHQLVSGSSYPSNADRLNRIYLANSAVRDKLGFKKDAAAIYCKLQ
jgi:hypothetical protein